MEPAQERLPRQSVGTVTGVPRSGDDGISWWRDWRQPEGCDDERAAVA